MASSFALNVYAFLFIVVAIAFRLRPPLLYIQFDLDEHHQHYILISNLFFIYHKWVIFASYQTCLLLFPHRFHFPNIQGLKLCITIIIKHIQPKGIRSRESPCWQGASVYKDFYYRSIQKDMHWHILSLF